MRDALRWVVEQATQAGAEFADARAVERSGASLRRQELRYYAVVVVQLVHNFSQILES